MCTAGNFLATAEELTSNGFRSVMEIDALGTFNMSRAAYPALDTALGSPCIINISATLHYGASWYQVCCCPAAAHACSSIRVANSHNSPPGADTKVYGLIENRRCVPQKPSLHVA